jgi:hypothetical protein
MNRLAQRIRSTGIVRGIVVLATLAGVWVAAGAPYTFGY